MGKFDAPNFHEEGINIVSIWASKTALKEIPENYFEENYGDEKDEAFNQFSSDFGFGFYDHDIAESAGFYGETIEEKLRFASYGESFCRAACAACDISSVESFFLMYDFAYNPDETGIIESEYYKFIGCFPYDKSA